jgi:hypothetical protein
MKSSKKSHTPAKRPRILIVATLLLAACTGTGSADPGTSNAVDAAANTPSGIATRRVIELTGASPEQITVLSEEAVDFGDASLDCPKPGMAYAQVITPGHRVAIRVGSRDYDVRVAGQRAVICDPRTQTGTKR